MHLSCCLTLKCCYTHVEHTNKFLKLTAGLKPCTTWERVRSKPLNISAISHCQKDVISHFSVFDSSLIIRARQVFMMTEWKTVLVSNFTPQSPQTCRTINSQISWQSCVKKEKKKRKACKLWSQVKQLPIRVPQNIKTNHCNQAVFSRYKRIITCSWVERIKTYT